MFKGVDDSSYVASLLLIILQNDLRLNIISAKPKATFTLVYTLIVHTLVYILIYKFNI